MSAVMKEFQTYSLHIIISVEDCNRESHLIRIVPTLLNELGFVIDIWYLVGAMTPCIGQLSSKRPHRVLLLWILFLKGSSFKETLANSKY